MEYSSLLTVSTTPVVLEAVYNALRVAFEFMGAKRDKLKIQIEELERSIGKSRNETDALSSRVLLEIIKSANVRNEISEELLAKETEKLWSIIRQRMSAEGKLDLAAGRESLRTLRSQVPAAADVLPLTSTK